MLSGPEKKRSVSYHQNHHNHRRGEKTYFAGLDRNRSRSVGFMEGKDTIQLLKQHEAGRGHSTGHHLHTLNQPKTDLKKEKIIERNQAVNL